MAIKKTLRAFEARLIKLIETMVVMIIILLLYVLGKLHLI